MKAKRQTKEQKAIAEIAAIQKRLRDILQGSQGGYSLADLDDPDGNHCLAQVVGIEEFGRFMGALEQIWGSEQKPFLFSMNKLKHFDTIESAAAWLHEHGCRA